MINNHDLLKKLNQLLAIDKFQDYCPNGLQVEGSKTIDRVVTGVSINQDLIDYAITKKAQAIIVHHGIFWHKDDYCITGIKYKRLKSLLENNINLYAYHLPLDNHDKFGNNKSLADLLKINIKGKTGVQDLIWFGSLNKPIYLDKFKKQLDKKLDRISLCLGNNDQLIKNIAWCTGGADSFFIDAIKLNVDLYITGETSEPTMSMAKESGVAYIGAGHYATERYGIKSLTKYIQHEYKVKAEFIELYNPV